VGYFVEEHLKKASEQVITDKTMNSLCLFYSHS